MRRAFAAVTVVLVLASGMSAAPRDERGPREKGNPIVKVIKKVIRSLGDGLIVPLP